jgi:hypothetical protein
MLMKKIDLSLYKNIEQYFIFYDIEIKKNKLNKDEFLESNGISPSSYWRTKKNGSKIGYEILEKLNNIFLYKMINDDIIDNIEKGLNRIYFNVYYKRGDSYEEDLKWIDEMLSERYVINPILQLFKLLLVLNSKLDPKKLIIQSEEMYKEIQGYINFYNDSLKEIYEIIYIAFLEDVNNEVLSYKYKNELSLFTLSSKCILKERYIESLYFAEKAKKIFISNENLKRVFIINLNLMAAYNYLHKFDECNLLAKRQIISLESYDYHDFEYEQAQQHYMISCVGLNKSLEIIELLKDKEGLTVTEYCCLFWSMYQKDKNEYKKFYEELVVVRNYDVFKVINNMITKKDKNALLELEQYKVRKVLIEILKKYYIKG